MNSEFNFALLAVLVGFFVAAFLAPWDSYFLGNFVYYWGSQLAVVGVSLIFKPRPIVLAGIATSLVIYLGAFGLWVHSLPARDAMVWLYYFLSLPGALGGAVVSTFVFPHKSSATASVAGLSTIAIVWAGAILFLWLY